MLTAGSVRQPPDGPTEVSEGSRFQAASCIPPPLPVWQGNCRPDDFPRAASPRDAVLARNGQVT